MSENEIAKVVVDTSIKIHQKLGPGLLEHVYEVVLAHELRKWGWKCERQVPVPIQYDNITFEEGYRIDLLVENKVIIEIKSITRVEKVHKKQLLTYLKLKNCQLGLLLNFGESLMKDGISRIVNELKNDQ